MTSYHGRDFSRDYILNNNLDVEDKDVYLFGIYSGWSCVQVGSDFKATGKKPNNFYGFDSFCGLCSEAEGVPVIPEWTKGNYNSQIHFNNSDTRTIIENIKKLFYAKNNRDIDLIEGFYSDVLTKELIKQKNMKPACFVDIDCDLYISAFQALSWLAENNLFKNTIVYFDDFISDENYGEKRALREVTEKFNLKVTKLFELPSYSQAVFEITTP